MIGSEAAGARRAALNPWWVVAGCTLAQMVGNGPTFQFTFGVFLKPVAQQFGWTRATVSLGFGTGLVLLAVATPFVGKLMDRFGVRRVALPAIPLFAASFAAIALTPASPLVFALLYALCGTCGAGQSAVGYVKVISSWMDERRGLALGVSMAGVGVGTLIVPRLAEALIVHYGWRYAYAGVGLCAFLVAFTAVALLVREAPQVAPARASGMAKPAGMTAREAAAGSGKFWLIVSAVALVAMVVNGTISHLVPMLTDRGMAARAAVSILSTVGLSTIVGRLLVGYLLDRVPAPYVAACFFLVPVGGIALLLTGAGGAVPLLAVLCLGLGLGAEIDLIGFLVGRYFGFRAFGEIYGYFYCIFALGSALGPYVMGLTFDHLHSYRAALEGFIGALLVASALIARLGAYAYPARRS